MSEKSTQVTLILKVFSIIQLMSKKQETSIKEISEHLALNTSTIYKCLQTLCDIGYVYQNEQTQQYGLTLKFTSIGSNILSHCNITEMAIPSMKKIGELTKETVHLGLREDSKLVYVYKIDSPHTLRMYSSIGKMAPLYCTAIGKVLLAFVSKDIQKKILSSSELIAYTPNTITNIEHLLSHLDKVKENGYGEDIEEHESHIRCISMPIFDHIGQVKAALSISTPIFRWNEEIQQRNLIYLKKGVKEISHKLGYNKFLIQSRNH